MKLKCNTIQRFISDYIDENLTSSEAAKVEDHLSFCQTCQKEVTALKRTRDLVVGFYVEPKVPDSYYHQFEVELHRCIESKGPTTLAERLKSSVSQFTWSLLTQVRHCISQYSFINRHLVPISIFLLIITTGFVAMHFLKLIDSPTSKEYQGQIGKPIIANGLTSVDENSELIHGLHNDYISKRKTPNQVSPSAVTPDTEKVGYWKLSKPISTETEGHIIVMYSSEDRAVPSDAADSELIVYADLDILSRKSPLQDGEYATFPSGHPVELFLAKYQRKHRKSPQFVNKLMDEHSKIPTLPELYDLSKF